MCSLLKEQTGSHAPRRVGLEDILSYSYRVEFRVLGFRALRFRGFRVWGFKVSGF